MHEKRKREREKKEEKKQQHIGEFQISINEFHPTKPDYARFSINNIQYNMSRHGYYFIMQLYS